jgi:asparagine synthase (glutamine-hydrolysing)
VSGFVVVLRRDGGRVDDALLERLAAPLAGRGPNGVVAHRVADTQGELGMVHAFLRAREGATVGPHCDDAGAWLAGDVRLDARDELRKALERSGIAVPPDAADEALVLAAWRAWGEGAASRIRGDFSFALWDGPRRILYCARDAMGVRPLYYAERDGVFVCSNALDAVRAHPAVGARLHELALVSFLQCGYNTELTSTMFEDVRRLAPAHQVVVRGDGPAETPRRHWTFPQPAPLHYPRGEDYATHYRAVLDQAVRDRARVPRLALLLSGGLDSTSLAVTLRRVVPNVEQLAITSSLSAVQPDDEARLAGLVTSRHGLRHEIVTDVPEPFGHLSEAGFHTPEPFDDPTLGGWRRVAQRIAAFTPVAFLGEDGDALFSPPGLVTMLRTRAPLEVLWSVARYAVAHAHAPYLGFWLGERLRHGGRRAPSPLDAPAPWIRPALIARHGVPRDQPEVTHPTRPEVQAALSSALWQSLHDGCDPDWTGAALEVRWPFLDTRLLEFTLSLPPVPWCQGKALVRRAFRNDLPDEILSRPKSPLRGYSEWQVARWRAGWDGRLPPLHAWTAELVDPSKLLPTLQEGTVSDVLAAWRVFALDQWFRNID